MCENEICLVKAMAGVRYMKAERDWFPIYIARSWVTTWQY